MPIYEYGCGKCGDQFEVLVRSKSDLPTKCPACGAPKPVKTFSSFAVSRSSSQSLPSACSACPTASPSCAESACATGSCPFS